MATRRTAAAAAANLEYCRTVSTKQYQYQTLSFAEKIDSNGSLQDKTATKELVVHA